MKRSLTWRNADTYDASLSARRYCFGGGGGASVDPQVGLAALQQAQLGKEGLDWYKGYVENTLTPLQQQQAQTNQRAADQAFRIADAQEARAAESYQDYRSTFRPVEQSLAADAMKFDEAGYRDKLAAQSAATVQSAFDQSEAQTNRDLARQGVTVGSGQATAMKAGAQLARAASMASAANDSRTQSEALGFARKQDVANMGRGIASNSTAQSQAALAGGQAASQAAGSSVAGATGIASGVQSAYGLASGAQGSAGSLFAQNSAARLSAAQAEANRNQQNVSAGVGAAATIAAAAFL